MKLANTILLRMILALVVITGIYAVILAAFPIAVLYFILTLLQKITTFLPKQLVFSRLLSNLK